MMMNVEIRDSKTNGQEMTITAALLQLKNEILQMQDQEIAQGRAPMFIVEHGELELKLVAKREISASGSVGTKLRLCVLDADAALNASRSGYEEAVQTLRIHFRAVSPSFNRPHGGDDLCLG
jgi:hypothetical protein